MKATFGRELRRGTLELVLLRLLHEGEKYGYLLVSELRERSQGLLEVREGTLYPVLYRLEKQGLIEPSWQQRERGVPRKYYKLTRSGTERLDTLASEWAAFRSVVDAMLAGRDDRASANPIPEEDGK